MNTYTLAIRGKGRKWLAVAEVTATCLARAKVAARAAGIDFPREAEAVATCQLVRQKNYGGRMPSFRFADVSESEQWRQWYQETWDSGLYETVSDFIAYFPDAQKHAINYQ